MKQLPFIFRTLINGYLGKFYKTLGEIRKDYVTDKFVILPQNSERLDKDIPNNSELCPYCPGNEHHTEPAMISLVSKEGILQRLSDSEDNIIENWSVRVFQKKNPIMTVNASSIYTDKPLYSEPAYGHHLIVVASPEHTVPLSKIPVEQWSNILLVIQERLRYLYNQKKVTYVSVYVNHGVFGGNDIDHPHFHMVTFAEIPNIIETEAISSFKYINENGNCPNCVAISIETDGPRQIISTENFIAFCPWSSIYPYEFCIYPKKHSTSFLKLTQKEINDLAMITRSTLGGMSNALEDPSYNLVFHLSPEKKNTRQIHWHVEIYPQKITWTGLERGYGIYVNPIKPEIAAELLGASSRKELAKLVGIT